MSLANTVALIKALIKPDISELKNAIQGILVEQTIGETVTVTNVENAYDYYQLSNSSSGLSKNYKDDVLKLTATGGTETSPYVNHANSWGTKKWILGFKYKLTKVSQDLGNPDSFRIHMGSNAFDEQVVWGEWIDFAQVQTLDLTRIRISMRLFASAPASGSFYIEIKDMYLYDATGIDNEMCNYIIAQQQANYQDGQVTYGETQHGYYPDTGLDTLGKAADSKAVGDAISDLRLNVKEHGVKGDGTTDDTDAINDLLEFAKGAIYFPAGTYKISGTITIPDSCEVYGDGDTTIFDMYSCDNLAECVFRNSDKVYPYILVNGDNVKLHDFKLTGNNTLQQKRHAGIGVLDVSSVVISDVWVYNVNADPTQDSAGTAYISGYGICVTRSSFVSLLRCNVERCGYECIGIVDECDQCVVRDCYTKNGFRCCIQVHRGTCNTIIENCYMLQDNATYHSCFTVHGVEDSKVRNLRLINNTMKCLQNGGQPFDYCAPVQIMSHVDFLMFEGNRVQGGMRAFYITNNSNNAKIIGNDFHCNEDSDYGVTITSTKTIVVGNYLENEAQNPVNTIGNNPVMAANVGIS